MKCRLRQRSDKRTEFHSQKYSVSGSEEGGHLIKSRIEPRIYQRWQLFVQRGDTKTKSGQSLLMYLSNNKTTGRTRANHSTVAWLKGGTSEQRSNQSYRVSRRQNYYWYLVQNRLIGSSLRLRLSPNEPREHHGKKGMLLYKIPNLGNQASLAALIKKKNGLL